MNYAFENFDVDVATFELRKDGVVQPMEKQVFDLLLLLVATPDRVISKDEIVDAVWGGRAISDAAINSRISTLRAALGDSGREQRLIKTIHNQGLRFVGELKTSPPPEAEVTATVLPSVAAMPNPDAKPRSNIWPFVGGIAMGAGLLGLILLARAPEGFDQTEAYSPWTLAQPTENYETRDAYLRGMKLREKSNGFALSLAADQFQQAIDGDAEFAPAYAALAAVDAAIFQNEPGANVALIAKTDRLIAQAKALSPKSPQVRLAEGEIAAFRGDYVGALSMASTLIEENPHFLAAYLLKGAALMELGRIDAARDTMDIAISLDPLSPEVLHIVSEAKYMTGDFDGAREAAKANLWWNPESTKSLLSMAHIERERGHYERAFDYLQRARHLNSLDSVVIYDLIELYSDLGLSQARAEVAQGHVQRSLVYAMIGNRDETDAALIQLDLRDVHVNIHYYLRDYETAAQRFDIFLSSRPDARIKPGDGLQYARMCLAYNRARQPQSDRICGLLAAYYTDKMPEDLHLRKDILGGAAYFLQSGDLPRALLWLDHLAVAGHSFSDLTTDPLFATLETTPDYAPIAAKMETTAQIQRRFIQRKLGD